MHLRQSIRGAIGAALTGLATTGANVFVSRVYPLQAAELPGLRVYAESESVEPATILNWLERVVTIKVEAIAKSTLDWHDTIDTICAEVEVALANPVATLDGIAESVTLTGTTIEMSGTTEQPVGMATMTFAVMYFAAENAPDVAV